jgi:hypothetical protein
MPGAVTYSLLQRMDAVTACFTRVTVTRISLGAEDSARFGLEPMLTAACLLADAHVFGALGKALQLARSKVELDRHGALLDGGARRAELRRTRTAEPARHTGSGNKSPGGHDG